MLKKLNTELCYLIQENNLQDSELLNYYLNLKRITISMNDSTFDYSEQNIKRLEFLIKNGLLVDIKMNNLKMCIESEIHEIKDKLRIFKNFKKTLDAI